MNSAPIKKLPLYDYSDPRVRQAGYAAAIYGVISLASALLFLLKARLDAIPASAVAFIASGVIVASISGVFAFLIFRRQSGDHSDDDARCHSATLHMVAARGRTADRPIECPRF